jgi:anti-anti-sigma regulatory factor
MDANGIVAMEGFTDKADDKGVKIALRGVNIAVYKVLKLVKLASRFSSVK